MAAHPDILRALHRTPVGDAGEYSIEIGQASEVVKIDTLPTAAARLLVDRRWDAAYFKATNVDLQRPGFAASLIVSKQLHESTPMWELTRLPAGEQAKIEENVRKKALGETGADGSSASPVLLAYIGDGDTETALEQQQLEGVGLMIAPAGTEEGDYWSMDLQAGKKPEASFPVSAETGIRSHLVTHSEVSAINRLFVHLVNGSMELIREAARTPAS